MPRKFDLGRIVTTSNARDKLCTEDVSIALARHVSGDWGEVNDKDRQANENAIYKKLRLFSVYHDRNNIVFWIITEADRSATTVLLPEDY